MAKKCLDLHKLIGTRFRHNWNWYVIAALSADGGTVFLKNDYNGKVKETLDAKTVKTIIEREGVKQ
jgi:hypothetical protein